MMINKKTLLAAIAIMPMLAFAQSFEFDMTKEYSVYSDVIGYGYDVVDAPTKKNNAPFFFSVKVPDGNYKVTVVLGSKDKSATTTVRAESRRLMVEKCQTKKKQFETHTFMVHKHSTVIQGNERLRVTKTERSGISWDDKLTLEFNGDAPAVKSIKIEPAEKTTTLFLCGNSTVVDQDKEPWASWGQMFPRWFNNDVCVANYAESGLSAASFMSTNRLEKILSMIKPGDYVFCEFGHNDEKEKGPGTGAWYHYSVNLKKYIDMVRVKGGNIILITPTQRRSFASDNKTLNNTHGEFPAAMKAVAMRENVPLIDLNASTKVLYETMGSEGSKHLLVHYPAGTFPWQRSVFADNTHFNPFGAYEVAKLVIMGLKEIQSPLINSIKDDWKDFYPNTPDDWTTFYWPQSPLFDGIKPDGN